MIISRLGDKHGLRSELDLGLKSITHELHNHFYTGRLNERDMALHQQIGETLCELDDPSGKLENA